MTRLILIRHGETDWNVEGRWQGHRDLSLNEKGHEQAHLAAGFVRSEFDIQNVWSSDLKRCMETARPLEMPVTTSQLLREVDYGSWEGRRFADLSPEDVVQEFQSKW